MSGMARLGSGPGMRMTSSLPGATAASLMLAVRRIARLAVHSARGGEGAIEEFSSWGVEAGKGVEEI